MANLIPFDDDEQEQLSRIIESYHEVFYALWNIGRPVYDKSLPTASIQFDLKGEAVQFNINPDFWAELSLEQKAFIICHECLHIILKHGRKAKNILGTPLMPLANFAMDVCVNELLTRSFGFDRKNIDPENKYCWADTVFKDNPDMSTRECFEYYFNRLKESGVGGLTVVLVDSHDGMGKGKGEMSEGMEKVIADALGKILGENLEDFEKKVEQHNKGEEKQTGQKAGTMAGDVIKKVKATYKPKRKWETVIKDWVSKHKRPSFKDIDQWANISRRNFGLYQDMGGKMFLPSEYELDAKNDDKYKIDVWFALDTSGSCAGFADRFWKAANTIPKDRFNLKLFCFDTQCYDVDIKKGELHGFGGTSFSCIEQYIQTTIKKDNKRYPHSVWLITDGMGDSVKPQFPERWHWFLTYDYKHYIPKQSKTFLLSDYE